MCTALHYIACHDCHNELLLLTATALEMCVHCDSSWLLDAWCCFLCGCTRSAKSIYAQSALPHAFSAPGKTHLALRNVECNHPCQRFCSTLILTMVGHWQSLSGFVSNTRRLTTRMVWCCAPCAGNCDGQCPTRTQPVQQQAGRADQPPQGRSRSAGSANTGGGRREHDPEAAR